MLSKSAELKLSIFLEIRALWLLQKLQLLDLLSIPASYSCTDLYSDCKRSDLPLLHSPATEQTIVGFICERSISVNSGTKSSTNLLHSKRTSLMGIKLQEPSNTSFSSSWVSLEASWSLASWTISLQISQIPSLSSTTVCLDHTVWIQCLVARHSLAAEMLLHQYSGPLAQRIFVSETYCSYGITDDEVSERNPRKSQQMSKFSLSNLWYEIYKIIQIDLMRMLSVCKCLTF